MGKHAQLGRPSRRRYPVLAAGTVLAVAGVSAVLLLDRAAPAASLLAGRGAPAAAVLAGGRAPAAASSGARTIYRCQPPGAGFSSLSVTAARACPAGGGWRFPAGATYAAPRHRHHPHGRTPAVTPAVTAAATPTVTPVATPTSSPSGAAQHFGLAPVGTSLPRSDAYCASQVQPMAENVPANTTANHTVPSGPVQFGPWAQRIANFAHVDGNFTGTTGEILEWAACKWGWNQDYAMAEAVRESGWRQSEVGANSYGILQVKVSPTGSSPAANTGWGGYPWVQQSTAFDADMQMAYLRACYDGDTPWLGNGYQAGDAWGCIGSWYSGQWHTAAADGYVGRVQAALASQAWLKL